MSDYVRPLSPPRVFVDDLGEPIRYGERWGAGSPPDDSYSVTSNLERFAPLHDVAERLIDWLVESYDVTVEDSPAMAGDLLRPPTDVVRAVRVRPADADAAALTFVFTSFPGIHLHAGCLVDVFSPVCGCDACDETWESCATMLEDAVFAVASGGLSEAYTRGAQLPVSFRLEFAEGWTGGSSSEADYPAERLDAARRMLTPLRVWVPWPARSASTRAVRPA